MTRNIVAIVVGTLVLVAWSASSRGAEAHSPPETGWVIERFDVTYAMQESGVVDVHEVIAVDFGTLSKHGIFRNLIRLRMSGYNDWYFPAGDYRRYEFSDVEIADASGNALPFTVTETRYGPSYRIGDPDQLVPAKIEYHIRYTLRYAVNLNHVDSDFPWDVTGNWPVPIGAATARVTLPGAVPAFSATCDRLAAAFIESCSAAIVSDGATFGPVRLGTNEQLVIRAAFSMDLMMDIGLRGGSVDPLFFKEIRHVHSSVTHVFSTILSLFREERMSVLWWDPQPAAPTPLPPRR